MTPMSAPTAYWTWSGRSSFGAGGDVAGEDALAVPEVRDVQVRGDPALREGQDDERLDAEGAEAEQVLLVAGGEAAVDAEREGDGRRCGPGSP